MRRLAGALAVGFVALSGVVVFVAGMLRRRRGGNPAPANAAPVPTEAPAAPAPAPSEAVPADTPRAAEAPDAFGMVAATFEHLSNEYEDLEREAAFLDALQNEDADAEDSGDQEPELRPDLPPAGSAVDVALPVPDPEAEKAMAQGNAFFQVGQYGLAVEQYTKALEANPGLTAAYYNRANARVRTGDLDLALGDYDRAVEAQPEDADALTNRGLLHLQRKEFAAAVRDFDAALALDPADTALLVNRGLTYLESGEPSRALQDFREAISLNQGDATAQYGAARAAGQMEDAPAALSHIRRALELDPRYAREAASDPSLRVLEGDAAFLQLLRDSGRRSGAD